MNVLVTGSSKGLGRELALTFARKGHGVILHGRDEARLAQVRQEIEALPSPVAVVRGDITDERTLRHLLDAARTWKIDVLINNAGAYLSAPIEETSLLDAERILKTNLCTPVWLTLAIYPLFRERGHGLIVNINSLAGKGFNDQEAAYCASKWGLRGFMGSFKFEARKHGISVLDVYLGKMRTDMAANRPGLIEPCEAARVIYELWRDYPTLRVNEIEIGRA